MDFFHLNSGCALSNDRWIFFSVAKQAKLLRQKTSLMVGEEDEEDEEKEEASEKKAPWGKRKKMYYNADNVDYEVSMIAVSKL